MSTGAEYWLVTVPNRGDPAEQTYGKLSRCTASSRNDFAEIHQIDVPQLVVGTLDSLMTLR